MKIKDDVTLQDVRRYGDLLNRRDWIYNRQNHSIQDWKYMEALTFDLRLVF